MRNLNKALSEFNQESIEIEEFKLLRQEIMYYNEASFRTELYVVASCGIIWAWIFANQNNLVEEAHIIAACIIPILLLMAGFVRFIALRFRVLRLAFYIRCIERKYFGESKSISGWEHFVGKTRKNDVSGPCNWEEQAKNFNENKYKWAFYSKTTFATWLMFLILTIAAASYVYVQKTIPGDTKIVQQDSMIEFYYFK